MATITKISLQPRRSKKLDKWLKDNERNMRSLMIDISTEWKKETQANLSHGATNKYPALRTGYLRSQVNPTGPNLSQVAGINPTLRATLIVDTEYATIQELGGQAGRNLASTIPPRPYAGPALRKVWRTVIAKAKKHLGF